MSSRAENSPFTLPGYDILEKLGEGGMGVVFKARDKKLERQVAIKFLYQDGDASKDANQVLQEARRLAQVNHPNVVSIYELCETQTETKKRSAIVMEFLSGTPLSDIHKEQLLSQNQKLSYLIQIARGMVAIHEAGLRHGDLKAENVWITNDNAVKLLDFGLSAEIDSKQSATNASDYSSASLTTLSPEFCLGQALTQQTDIFNFGCLACQLLTDKLPFDVSTQEEVQRALRTGELTSASQLSPALSGALAQVLDHCLMVEPKARPDSFARLYQELSTIEDALKQQQLANNATMVFDPLASAAKQPAETRQKPAVSPAQRNKLLAIFASLVLLVTASVFVWHKSNQPPPEKSVLVFPAKMTGEAEMPPEQIRMIKAALDNTLRDSVINIRSLNLISRSELDSVADDLNSSLKATGASNALQPLVDCQGASCQITIELINGKTTLIDSQVRWHSNVLDVYEISTVAQSQFQQLFPDYPVTDGDVITVSKEAYEEFARLYAELQFNAGNTKIHLKELGELLDQNPYLFSGYRLYRESALKVFLDSGNNIFLDSVKSMLEKSPKEYQRTTAYTWDLFLVNLYSGKFDAAKLILDKASINGVDDITITELTGAYYLEKDSPSEAKIFFQKALSYRMSVNTLYNLALTHWYLGESKAGISTLKQLLDISVDFYPAKQLLGSMYLYTGQLTDSIEIFTQLTRSNPENNDLTNLGLAYLLKGEKEKALNYTIMAYQNSPSNNTLILNLADTEALVGKIASANTRYRQLLTKLENAEDLDSLLIKAQAHIHLGNQLDSIRVLNEASKLSPNNGEVAFVGSLIYTKAAQQISAVASTEEALASGIGTIWYNLPWFTPLCKSDDFKRVISEYYIDGVLPCNDNTPSE